MSSMSVVVSRFVLCLRLGVHVLFGSGFEIEQSVGCGSTFILAVKSSTGLVVRSEFEINLRTGLFMVLWRFALLRVGICETVVLLLTVGCIVSGLTVNGSGLRATMSLLKKLVNLACLLVKLKDMGRDISFLTCYGSFVSALGLFSSDEGGLAQQIHEGRSAAAAASEPRHILPAAGRSVPPVGCHHRRDWQRWRRCSQTFRVKCLGDLQLLVVNAVLEAVSVLVAISRYVANGYSTTNDQAGG